MHDSFPTGYNLTESPAIYEYVEIAVWYIYLFKLCTVSNKTFNIMWTFVQIYINCSF